MNTTEPAAYADPEKEAVLQKLFQERQSRFEPNLPGSHSLHCNTCGRVRMGVVQKTGNATIRFSCSICHDVTVLHRTRNRRWRPE